jgi:hypothetical protein
MRFETFAYEKPRRFNQSWRQLFYENRRLLCFVLLFWFANLFVCEVVLFHSSVKQCVAPLDEWKSNVKGKATIVGIIADPQLVRVLRIVDVAR